MMFKSHVLLLISLIYSCLTIQKYESYDASSDKDISQFIGDYYIKQHLINVKNEITIN